MTIFQPLARLRALPRLPIRVTPRPSARLPLRISVRVRLRLPARPLPRPSVRALPAAAVLACLATLAAPAPAAVAHPFGPPSTAVISAEGSRVSIAWRANEDDWVALGQSLGAFEDPASGTVSQELTGEQKLARSPAVHTYLLRHIKVAQAGRPCRGEVSALERLLSQGARLTFDCPAPPTEVDVTVSALTDLNESYRTMLTAESAATPRQSLFTAVDRTHRLRFSATGGGVRGSVAGVAGGTAAALLAVVGVLLLRRNRRRQRKGHRTAAGSGSAS
ncbi:hypothetical protein [Streptomyces lushanensis]|uniref:hypothetical protein n=1 Tax=Streptomyces lushanensis TaxID=1434255 RepID=UPI000837197D|nr:hypothetical protein [Streptomyces lushanensis]